MGALVDAHSLVAALGDQEFRAVIRSDLEALRRLEDPLREARKARDQAMLALRDHLAQHGC